jgi:predicted GNAT family N-acyltransferase
MTDVRLATTMPEIAHAFQVRNEVFVVEQGVPKHLEIDELDDTADHFIAYDDAGVPVGAGRLVIEPAGFEGAPDSTSPVGHLGRLAVMKPARGTGLGVRLVEVIELQASKKGLRLVALSAQTQAIGFYERLGYTAHGPEFDDAGLPHRWMTKSLA